MPKKSFSYFKKLGKGCRFDPYDGRDKIFCAPPRVLPEHIDNKEECTDIRNQGEEGTCVGHAAVAAAELLYWRKLAKPPDFSERWAYEKAKLYDEWEGTNYEGTSVRGAVKAWEKVGMCPEDLWPYTPNKPGKPKSEADEKSKEFPIAQYERCFGLDNIKHAIHFRGCVLAGAQIHEGWFKSKKVIPYKSKYLPHGGHAILLVGYDDKKEILWVRNSWGKEWGDKGYAGLTYKDASLNIVDAWMVSIPD